MKRWPLLGVSRVALGVIFVVRTTALANLLPTPLAHVRGVLLGWPESGWPMAWAGAVVPAGLQEAACVVRTGAAVLFLLGIRARIAGVIAGALGLLAMSQDPFGFIYTLYTLFTGTLVLAATDATSELALVPDRPLNPRSSGALVRLVVAAIYFWASVAKMRRDWLSGATLLALAEERLFTEPVASLLRDHGGLRLTVAWGTMATELALAPLLFFFRSRRIGVGVALGMHLAFEIGARPDVMGGVMASLLVACAAGIE
jgi:Vitamin K-dependent gamma-carboxylase